MVDALMTTLKDAREHLNNPRSQVHWVKLITTLAGLVLLSIGFAALLQLVRSRLNIDLPSFPFLAYASVFGISLLANMTIIAPVPFAVAIMIAAARDFNPVLVALSAATGGTIGELSGYYAGRLGKKIAISDGIFGQKTVERWIKKYGIWAVTVMAFQPIIPFDVGGLVAGAAGMPIRKFLPALWVGKFPKYVILTYAGLGVINFLPKWLVG